MLLQAGKVGGLGGGGWGEGGREGNGGREEEEESGESGREIAGWEGVRPGKDKRLVRPCVSQATCTGSLSATLLTPSLR